MTKIDGYWFAASDRLPHGDGRLIKIGGTHRLRGEIIICVRGFHCSRHPFDALQYATGPYIYQVRVWGDVQEQEDKLCGRNRTYVAVRDATAMLFAFARKQALTCVDAWDAPEVVRRFLETGDPAIRGEAERAARRAARSAARSAARGAERSAERSAAMRAAESAAGSASRETFEGMVKELFA